MDADPRPTGPPPLRRPVIMDQVWADVVFVHWRVDSALVAPWMPAGARPHEHDGSSWVGLVAFGMRDAGFGQGHPVPWFGTFEEINVRLYSTDADGRRGVVFRSLDADRLPVVAAANLARVRYRWSRIRVDRAPGRLAYRCRRIAPPGRGAHLDLSVRTTEEDRTDDPLGVFLTARWCLHHQALGRPVHVPNTHGAWPLRTAVLERCDDTLLAAAGFPGVADREPDSVLWSPGVRTQFGLPGGVTT